MVLSRLSAYWIILFGSLKQPPAPPHKTPALLRYTAVRCLTCGRSFLGPQGPWRFRDLPLTIEVAQAALGTILDND